jgi:hypothetical protein
MIWINFQSAIASYLILLVITVITAVQLFEFVVTYLYELIKATSTAIVIAYIFSLLAKKLLPKFGCRACSVPLLGNVGV